METLVTLLLFLVSLSFLLKLSQGSTLQIFATAISMAVATVLSEPWAIEQSRTQIADWLANPALMQDTSVLLTLDVALLLSYYWLSVKQSTLSTRYPRLWAVLRWYPMLTGFVVCFSAQVALLFALPGVDFWLISILCALLCFVLIVGACYGLRYLLPEGELRAELGFLSAVVTALVGTISTVHGQTTATAVTTIDWTAMGFDTLLFITCALVGWLYYRWRTWRTARKQNLNP